MRKVKTVVFDMDGVIFDSENLVLGCWEKIGEKYKIPNIRDVFVKCIGTSKVKTEEIVCDYYGPDFDYDKIAKESSLLFHEYVDANGLPMKKGVRELLTYLQDAGFAIGLASSTRLAVVEEELKQAGLHDFFQVIVGGDQLQKSKPNPDIYLMACEKMKVAPEKAYAIEDSHNGIRAAYLAGMMPIMVPDLLEVTEEMKEKSIVILDDLLQVMAYFQQEESE